MTMTGGAVYHSRPYTARDNTQLDSRRPAATRILNAARPIAETFGRRDHRCAVNWIAAGSRCGGGGGPAGANNNNNGRALRTRVRRALPIKSARLRRQSQRAPPRFIFQTARSDTDRTARRRTRAALRTLLVLYERPSYGGAAAAGRHLRSIGRTTNLCRSRRDGGRRR